MREGGGRYEGMREGREHELDLFGKFKETPEYRAALKRIIDRKGYVNFNESLDLVKRFSPEDPHHPDKEFLRDLRLEVADRIGMDDDAIDALTSVGTPFDLAHGTDAFILIRLPGGGDVLVTLDGTKNDEKLSGVKESKADLIIGEVPSPESDAYLDFVESYAKKVAKIFKEREKRGIVGGSAHP